MHLHTKGNSVCAKETPKDIIDAYKNAGYDGIVCTNHFSKFIYYKYFAQYKTEQEKVNAILNGFYKLKEIGAENGIDVFFGLELAILRDDYHNVFRRKCEELLVYGITDEEFRRYNVRLAEMNYKQLYEFANKHNWIIAQAHPYRARTKLANPKYLHAMEVYNGHPGHYDRNELAKERGEQYRLIPVAGSDFHNLGGEGTGLMFDTKVNDEQNLVQLLKNTSPKIFMRNKGEK